MNETIVTHPNNKRLLEAVSSIDRNRSVGPFTLGGMTIVFDEYMPERNIETVWHPPEPSRLFEVEASDEDWARPLGIGRVEEIDCGPLFYKMRLPGFRDFMPPFFAR